MIILGDGSWDCDRLQSSSGGYADKYEVLARAHSTFSQIFTVICKCIRYEFVLQLYLVPSQNFDNEITDGRTLRNYLEQEVSKPADNFYAVKSRQQVKRTLELHADDIVDKFRYCFNE